MMSLSLGLYVPQWRHIHTVHRTVLRTTRVLVSQTLRSLSNPLEMNMPVSCGNHWTVCTLYLWRYLLDLPTEHTEGNVHFGTPSVFVTSCMTMTPSAPPDNKLKHKSHGHVRNYCKDAFLFQKYLEGITQLFLQIYLFWVSDATCWRWPSQYWLRNRHCLLFVHYANDCWADQSVSVKSG